MRAKLDIYIKHYECVSYTQLFANKYDKYLQCYTNIKHANSVHWRQHSRIFILRNVKVVHIINLVYIRERFLRHTVRFARVDELRFTHCHQAKGR